MFTYLTLESLKGDHWKNGVDLWNEVKVVCITLSLHKIFYYLLDLSLF